MARKKDELETVNGMPVITRNTPQKEALLGIGYEGMTKADAQTIIKEREEKPELWPYEEYKKAKAFLLALATDPIPVSTRKGWKRSPAYGGV